MEDDRRVVHRHSHIFNSVPKRDVADDLLDCYDTFVYPLGPDLHIPTFRKRYSRIWEPQEKTQFDNVTAEACFYATLNMIFALGSLNSAQVQLHKYTNRCYNTLAVAIRVAQILELHKAVESTGDN